MKFYKAAQLIRVSGNIGLTKESAARRIRTRQIAARKGKNAYTVATTIDVKAGELVGFEDEPPKHLFRSFVGGENGDCPLEADPETGEVKPAEPAEGGNSGEQVPPKAPDAP